MLWTDSMTQKPRYFLCVKGQGKTAKSVGRKALPTLPGSEFD
jgi:hypothetical protein